MAGLATERDILSIPKVELHVHYGGNFSEAIAVELAGRHGVDPFVMPLENGRYPARFTDFPDFLRALVAIHGLIRAPEDVETVAAAFARGQAAQAWAAPTSPTSSGERRGQHSSPRPSAWSWRRASTPGRPRGPIDRRPPMPRREEAARAGGRPLFP